MGYIMEKKCFKCGVVKPIEEFYAHPAMGDGHLGKCKECTKKDTKERTILHSDIVRAYDCARAKTKERIQYSVQHTKDWRLKNPEKYKAHCILNNALRDKKIIKSESCQICGKQKKLQAHHYDYSKPLDVIWICAECHGQIQ